MTEFKEISANEIAENPFKLIGKDWALVTSGNNEKFNTMTVSWGGVGIMWGKPCAFTFIRPQRYTFEFLENNGYFTMSFFDEEYRKALNICGSKSGRDVDKIAECGLTPQFTEDGIPYFKEAKMVFVCKKLYSQFLNKDSISDTEPEAVEKWYGENDYHKMYISEICKVFTK